MDRSGIPKRIRGLHVGHSSSSAELSDREIVARIRKRRIALGLAFLAPIDLPAESGGLLGDAKELFVRSARLGRYASLGRCLATAG